MEGELGVCNEFFYALEPDLVHILFHGNAIGFFKASEKGGSTDAEVFCDGVDVADALGALVDQFFCGCGGGDGGGERLSA